MQFKIFVQVVGFDLMMSSVAASMDKGAYSVHQFLQIPTANTYNDSGKPRGRRQLSGP